MLKRNTKVSLSWLAVATLVVLMSTLDVHGQTPDNNLEQLRKDKAASLSAPQQSGVEKFLNKFQEMKVIQKLSQGFDGIKPKVGGLSPYSSLALGSEFETSFSPNSPALKLSAQGSIRGYQKYEATLHVPKLNQSWLSLDLDVTRRSFTQERFFGFGNDSSLSKETDFKQDDTRATATVAVHPNSWLSSGVRSGIMWINIDSGTAPGVQPTDKLFSSSSIPGLSASPEYLVNQLFVDVDYRDHPGSSHKGGHYSAAIGQFSDRKQEPLNFRRYDFEGEQYFPFFNRRRVIALRAIARLTGTSGQNQVPFYLQPVLGGSDDLRGYAEQRFRDRNLMLMNAEYRWEAFSGLDLALFSDSGQVAPSPSQFHFDQFKTSYGIGFRLKASQRVFLRTDIAFSRDEGRKTIIRFGHVF